MPLCLVEGNADEPGTQPRVRSKSAQILKCLHERLLNYVFRISLIPHYCERYPAKPVFMGTNEVIEEIFLPRNDKRNEHDFISYRGCFNTHTYSHSDNWIDIPRDLLVRQFKRCG